MVVSPDGAAEEIYQDSDLCLSGDLFVCRRMGSLGVVKEGRVSYGRELLYVYTTQEEEYVGRIGLL